MIDKEKEKYMKIYHNKGIYTKNGKIDETGNIRKKYGHENNGKPFIKFIKKMKISSLVDIGCGHNEFVELIKNKLGIKAIGVDFACPSADFIADAADLPFEDKEFDLVTCFDCLEHIPEEKIDKVLSEFRRVAKRFLVMPCLRGAPSRIDHCQLHVCKKDSDWWLDKVKNSCHDICQISYYKRKRMVGKKQANKLVIYGIYENLL